MITRIPAFLALAAVCAGLSGCGRGTTETKDATRPASQRDQTQQDTQIQETPKPMFRGT